MKTLRCLFLYSVKHKAILYQLYFIGKFLQEKANNRVFEKLDSRYAEFPAYSNYFGRALILLKSMYVVTNSGKLFADDFKKWLFEVVFVQYQCQLYIYYKYSPDGTKIVVLYYVDYCVYWYTSEALVKWFLGNLVKIFHVNFLGYAHLFMSIRIYQMRYHYISVDQARYSTSIVAKYLDTDTVNTSTTFYKTTFPYHMIFSKADAYTSDEQV